MKTRFTKGLILWLVITSVLLPSCNKLSVDVSKRKYRHGFFVDVSSTKKNTDMKKRGVVSKTKNHPKEYSDDHAVVSSLREKNECKEDENVREGNSAQATLVKKEKLRSGDELKVVSKNSDEIRSEKAATGVTKPVEKESPDDADNSFLLWSALFGTALTGAFLLSRKRSKKISKWAKENKWKTRALIVAMQGVLAVSGFFIGDAFYSHDLLISSRAGEIMAAAFLAAMLTYPVKNLVRKSAQPSYVRHKLSDLALVTTGFLMMISFGNQVGAVVEKPTAPGIQHSYSFREQAKNYAAHIIKDFRPASVVHSSLKEFNGNGPDKVALAFLAILLLAILFFLFAALACGISCGGLTAGGVFLLLAGIILSIVFFVMVLARLFSSSPKG